MYPFTKSYIKKDKINILERSLILIQCFEILGHMTPKIIMCNSILTFLNSLISDAGAQHVSFGTISGRTEQAL